MHDVNLLGNECNDTNFSLRQQQQQRRQLSTAMTLFFSVSTVQKLNFDSINSLCIFYVIYFIRCANQCAHIVSLVICNLEATSCRNAFSSSCKLCIIFLLVFAYIFSPLLSGSLILFNKSLRKSYRSIFHFT